MDKILLEIKKTEIDSAKAIAEARHKAEEEVKTAKSDCEKILKQALHEQERLAKERIDEEARMLSLEKEKALAGVVQKEANIKKAAESIVNFFEQETK
ncbi:MAG TPA: hypothetical protein VFF28_01705 [Candidatus Nanoarchaeia archaeon]|nr:hypothetical protein [Candidatus Nanoarchaeia archaeon]